VGIVVLFYFIWFLDLAGLYLINHQILCFCMTIAISLHLHSTSLSPDIIPRTKVQHDSSLLSFHSTSSSPISTDGKLCFSQKSSSECRIVRS